MDEYIGWYINGNGSGIECWSWSGSGYGCGYAYKSGNGYGDGDLGSGFTGNGQELDTCGASEKVTEYKEDI